MLLIKALFKLNNLQQFQLLKLKTEANKIIAHFGFRKLGCFTPEQPFSFGRETK